MNFVTVTVFTVMSVVGVSQARAPTENLLSLAYMLSGNFTNVRQIANERANEQARGKHDFITTLSQPVHFPSLSEAVTLYCEEVDNGKIYRAQILFFSEVDNEIHVQPLNVSGFDSYKPGELQNSDWSKVSLEPADELCQSVYRLVEKDVYMGTIPDCTRKTNNIQQLPYYASTVTCNAVNMFIYFETSKEADSAVPYVFTTKTRFPLPEYWTDQVNGYTPPCGYS